MAISLGILTQHFQTKPYVGKLVRDHLWPTANMEHRLEKTPTKSSLSESAFSLENASNNQGNLTNCWGISSGNCGTSLYGNGHDFPALDN